jgi:hypothetical protein
VTSGSFLAAVHGSPAKRDAVRPRGFPAWLAAAQDSWQRSALLLSPLTVTSVQEHAAIYAPIRAQPI